MRRPPDRARGRRGRPDGAHLRRSEVEALHPTADIDGELLRATLPRLAPVSLNLRGWGYLVANGEITVLHMARP